MTIKTKLTEKPFPVSDAMYMYAPETYQLNFLHLQCMKSSGVTIQLKAAKQFHYFRAAQYTV